MNRFPHSLLSLSTYLCYYAPEFCHLFNRKYHVWHVMQIYLSWIYQSLVQYHFPMARMILWILRFQLNQMKDTTRKNCSTFCLQKFAQTEPSIKTAITNFRLQLDEHYTQAKVYTYAYVHFQLPDILHLVRWTINSVARCLFLFLFSKMIIVLILFHLLTVVVSFCFLLKSHLSIHMRHQKSSVRPR